MGGIHHGQERCPDCNAFLLLIVMRSSGKLRELGVCGRCENVVQRRDLNSRSRKTIINHLRRTIRHLTRMLKEALKE